MIIQGLCVLLLVSGAHSGVIRVKSGHVDVKFGQDIQMSDLPSSMSMEFPVADNVVEMQLTKSATVANNIPVLLGIDEHAFVMWSGHNTSNHVVYEDPEKMASFVMWSGGDESKHTGHVVTGHGMMGMFNNGEHTYSVEPMDSRQTSRQAGYYGDDDEPVMVTMNGAKLTMKKVRRSELNYPDVEQMVSDEVMRLKEHIQVFMSQHVHESSNKMTYEIELFLVADYSMFSKWLGRSRDLDYEVREKQAINYIRYYMASVLSAVGLQYGQVRENANRILIRPVAIYIAKTARASPWTERASIKQDYHYNEAHDTLEEFKKWISGKENVFPSFDQAILLTVNDLFCGYLDGRRHVINGMSNMMGVCGSKRVSVIHDGGQYATSQVTTHQLAHSLGAYHDGFDNDCHASDGYVMAGTAGTTNTNNIDESYQFSRCSKRAMWDFLYYLTANQTNCLTQRDNYVTTWEPSRYQEKYLGQRFSPDEQCMMTHGLSSRHCGIDDGSICNQMYCWVAFRARCEISDEPAANGTTCGDEQWCMGGTCVTDPDALGHDASPCLESNPTIQVSTCYETAMNEPHTCYDSNFRSSCCGTCELLYRDGQADEGCEYGNKNPEICHNNFTPTDCYSDSDTCCQLCRQYFVNITGCEYGDKSNDCDKAPSTPSMCYMHNDTCCATCPRLQVGVKGCEWGDKQDWCTDYPTNYCYDSDFANNCCEYCSRHRGGSAGCEWGDHDSSCTQDDCVGDQNRARCCNTCSMTTTKSTTIPEQFQADQIVFDVVNSAAEANHICEDTGKHCDEIKGGHDCYDFKSKCCATCSKYETNDPTCLYGDRISWCKDYVTKSGQRVCDPYIESECCESCNVEDQTQGASLTRACTDDADWCEHIFPALCYKASTRKTCCVKCAGLKQTGEKCKYGDAYSWCRKTHCKTDEKECCQSCPSF